VATDVAHTKNVYVGQESILEVASKSEARARWCDRNGADMRFAEGERARGADGPAII
jgi:hypothetical protein